MMEPPTGTVTFLFTDIEGSTRLWEERPDEMRAALAEHDALLRAAFDAHNGYVFSTGGDGFAVAFSRAHDAVDAAAKAQAALADHPLLRVRMGIHTGEVQERDGDYFGPAVNRAARIMAVGHGGQILASAATRGLINPSTLWIDLGEHRLRDLMSAERLFQVNDGTYGRLRSVEAFATNLPAQTSELIGRDDEIAELMQRVHEHRVVTLTGVGGVGKTRLAVHVAAEVLADFADGVWLVDLAPVIDADGVAGAFAAALGLQQRSGLTLLDSAVEYLRHKQVLVVLDNCEHVLEAAAELVGTVIAGCPMTRLVVTSREALAIDGEWVKRVASLAVPVIGIDSAAALTIDGVRLFVSRVEATGAAIGNDDATVDAVAEIVRRLDGIPLAIELAAARVEALGVGLIAEHLDQRFRLLTGGPRGRVERHRTLRSAVQWSFDLLDENERAIFGRLAVFTGSFSPAAAIAVVRLDPMIDLDVLDVVAGLVAKSMVVAGHVGGEVRYRMLETLRQFGYEQLESTGAVDMLRHRHAAYFAQLADRAEPGLCSAEEATWVTRVEQDLDNYRAAFEWSSNTGDVDAALRIASAMGRFGWGRGASGALALARRAVELPHATEHAMYAWVAGWAAHHAHQRGDHDSLLRLKEAAEASAAQTGAPVHSWLYGSLGAMAVQTGDREGLAYFDKAISVARETESAVDVVVHLTGKWAFFHGLGLPTSDEWNAEGLRMARALANPTALAMALFQSGMMSGSSDPLAAMEEAVACAVRVGNASAEAYAQAFSGEILVSLGRPHDALCSSDRALRLFDQEGNLTDIYIAIEPVGLALAKLHHDDAAAAILGAVEAGPYAHSYRESRSAALAELRTRLDDAPLDALLERGRAMPLDELVAFVAETIRNVATEPRTMQDC